MKAFLVLLLLSLCVWLGYEYYKNGETIAQQEATIQQMRAQLQKQRAAQVIPPKPSFRLNNNKQSGQPAVRKLGQKSESAKPARRFK